MKKLNKQTVDEILRLTIAYYASGDTKYLKQRLSITDRLAGDLEDVIDVIESIGRLSYYNLLSRDQVYAALQALGYEVTMSSAPRINTALLELTINQQFAKFWPNRLNEYELGLLEVNVILIKTQTDFENYKLLRQQISIDDPTCTLIVGFLRAEFYVALSSHKTLWQL